MGVVYRAYDSQLDSQVALKTLRAIDAAAIYRFKREFRALADISHPNLVSLHELVSSGDAWFFTMELVEGVDFTSWVREGGVSNLDRLRGALLQLAQGIEALHALRRFHRDIKPTNVLVTPEARVVLLDFGLVTMLAEESADPDTMTSHVVGTIGYMAPEQAAGMPVTAASDWYSVGVMLFEALTGRGPFIGKPFDILAQKQRTEAPRPSTVVADLPPDLEQLCAELLSREPRKRPSGAHILARLGGTQRPAAATTSARTPRAASTTAGAILVSRDAQLRALMEAYAAAQKGRTVVVHLHGSSGMGKSSLARRFVEELPEATKSLVLSGRCYERESVPFKAFDSMMDALSRHLMRLPREEAKALLPRDILFLARIFPSLWRVKIVREAEQRAVETNDPREHRRLAFAALRELLARLSSTRPLVLFIDDLQWGDLDSTHLIGELLRPPNPPPLLFVMCFRSEDRETSLPLRSLLAQRFELPVESREVALLPLGIDDAMTLALHLLSSHGEDRHAEAEAIARESAGSPFFVSEIARHATRVRSELLVSKQRGEINFDGVLYARLERLPANARKLLELIAVAGRPVSQAVALKAVDLGTEAQPTLVLLLSEHLVRTRLVGEEDAIETYHDRIREALVKKLEKADLERIHLKIAEVLLASNVDDPESLALHFFAAGDRARGAFYAAQAGNKASAVLAFDRAAELYRLAIEPYENNDRQLGPLYLGLANALANLGRGPEAARAYEQAALRTKSTDEALELTRARAEQLLRSGHVDEGLIVVETLLGKVGMQLARTPRRAIASLLFRRAQVRLRGLDFTPRAASTIAPAELMRIDILWSVAMGLAMVDTARGNDFQSRHLLLALKAGEPYRLARAMCMEACYSATGGSSTRARTEHLLAEASRLSKELGHPHAIGLSYYAAGVAAFLDGRFLDAKIACTEAERIFREETTGAAWEIASARVFRLWSIAFLGELTELSSCVKENLREALERGDRYAAANLRTGLACLAWLTAGDPAGAQTRVDETMSEWSQKGFHIQHYYDLVARAGISLYRGEGKIAHERVLARWPELSGSLLLLVQFVRIDATCIRARTALAHAIEVPSERTGLLAAIEKDLHKVEKEEMPWGMPLAKLLRAGVKDLRGERSQAMELYASARDGFRGAKMSLYEMVATWRWAELLGGERGDAELMRARTWLQGQGAANAERIVWMMSPKAV
jgi:serine/threonine protein kinase/tetratricopeptide (TPR) repeat protein